MSVPEPRRTTRPLERARGQVLVSRLAPLQHGHALDWAALGGATIVAALLGLALVKIPALAIVVAMAATVAVALGGLEFVILTGLLVAVGLVPFVDPGIDVVPRVPLWVLALGVATGAMLLAWGSRQLARRPGSPIRPNLLLVALLALLVDTALVMGASQPLEVPSFAAAFVTLPVVALVTFLWLSHDDALAGLQRVLPVAVGVMGAWGLAYVGGAAGACSACVQAVSSEFENQGLLGPASRLYTPGQNAFLAFVLIAFAQAVRRPKPWPVALTALGLLCVALQASRAQYVALLAGLAVILFHGSRQLDLGRRVGLGISVAIATAALALSPVGERALSGYVELAQGSGTGGYRLVLLSEAANTWSLFGRGVSTQVLTFQNSDLGLPNTLLVLGFVGAGLQLTVVALGLVRGLGARNTTGVTLAAIFLLLLVARPSLPLLEIGSSTVAYATALGFAAALHVRPDGWSRPGDHPAAAWR